MKADKTVRLLKTVPPVQISFNAGNDPAISPISGQSSAGWSVVSASNSATNELIQLTWEDEIDIGGISASDLSLINQGGALARCRLPACGFPETGSVVFTTYVSVNPIRGTFSQRYLYGNSLNTPGESQDWFLATSQTFTRDSTGAGWMTKVSENNWGTGGIANTTRLFVKCFVQVDRLAIYVAQPGAPGAYSTLLPGALPLDIPPTTIGMMAITADMDAVQTAAAIYRGNDLQQSYDNP